MAKPMIENSERGITINKTLAWGMLLSLVSLVWFGGTTVASLQTSTENLGKMIEDTRKEMAQDRRADMQMDIRVRSLETSGSRQEAIMSNFRDSLEEVKAGQREVIELLREMKTGPRQ